MKRNNKKMRIGQVSNNLNLEQSVIRFWEKEFNIKSKRSHGGQRLYSKKDVETLKIIKHLLYEKGFTIPGAKQHIQQVSNDPNTPLTFKAATLQIERNASNNNQQTKDKEISISNDQIVLLHEKLVKLRELL